MWSSSVFIFSLLLASISSTNIEETKGNVIKLLEDIYGAVWATDALVTDRVVSLKLKKVCDLIDDFNTEKVPPAIIPRNVNGYIKDINSKYENFTHLFRLGQGKATTQDWQKFKNLIKVNFEEKFYNFTDSIYNHRETGLFRQYSLMEIPKPYEMLQSEQQALYNLYTLVQIAQLKAYTVLQAVFSLLEPDNGRVEKLRERFYFTSQMQPPAMKNTLDMADIYYWTHGPYVWNKGITYDILNYKTFVSLNPVNSDTNSNKVIVGMRLIKVLDTVYIQPKQGILLPNGKVNPFSVDWVPLQLLNKRAKKNNDYYSFNTRDPIFQLDEIKLPENYLLTGVAFRLRDGEVGLQVMSTKFNFSTGVLNNSDSRWVVEPYHERTILSQSNEDPRGHRFDSISSEPGTKITFYRTNTTDLIPFIDVQPVTTDPPAPLSGAGIHVKGHTKTGGIIGLEFYTVDMAEHFHTKPLPFKEIMNLSKKRKAKV